MAIERSCWPCPCGRGQIVHTVDDNDKPFSAWGNVEDLGTTIECSECSKTHRIIDGIAIASDDEQYYYAAKTEYYAPYTAALLEYRTKLQARMALVDAAWRDERDLYLAYQKLLGSPDAELIAKFEAEKSLAARFPLASALFGFTTLDLHR